MFLNIKLNYNFDRVAENVTFKLIDIYNSVEVAYYKMALTVLFTLSTILLLLYSYLIIYHTPKDTGNFKLFSLINISFLFATSLAMNLWKPILLFPFLILYPVGWLSPMSMTMSTVLLFIIIWGIVVVLDSNLLVLLERYFLICQVTSRKIRNYKKFCYVFIFVSNAAAVSSTYYLSITAIPDVNLATDVLKKHLIISNPIDQNQTFIDEPQINQTLEKIEIFLNESYINQDQNFTDDYSSRNDSSSRNRLYEKFFQQSSLFIFPPSNLVALLIVGIWSFFIATRILFLVWMFYNNFIIIGTLTHILCESMKKKFNLMLKVALSNICSAIVIILPAGIIFLVLLTFNEINEAETVCLAFIVLLTSFPVFNVIFLMIFVRHFREAIQKTFSCLRSKTNIITVVDIRTDQTNTDNFEVNFDT